VGRRDESANEGTQYLAREDLHPLAPAQEGEDFLSDVLRRLSSSDDWSLQFGAIDDARRLARFAPRVLVSSGQTRKLVGSIASLVESLRSSLAKNALRCMGELFAALGKKMDQCLDAFLPVVLKRAADTNVFISEEAGATLREICWHAGDAKALAPALAAATNRQPKIRIQAVSCLAMLAQRLRGKGSLARTSVQAIIEATMKELERLFPTEIGAQLPDGGAKLRKYAVVKVPRSVYAAVPGRNKYRPSQETPIKNFTLSGDWTSQKFLGSMEGAVLSGKLAAEVIACKAAGEPTQGLKEIEPHILNQKYEPREPKVIRGDDPIVFGGGQGLGSKFRKKLEDQDPEQLEEPGKVLQAA